MGGGAGELEPEEDAGAVVQRYFKSWAMGRLDAQVFIQKLNQLDAIRAIGGVSAGCRRRIEEHQFDHDLTYSDFLRALRNTGKPPPMVDYLDRERNHTKKIFVAEDERKTQEVLFPDYGEEGVELAGVVDKRTGRPLSVVDGKQINNK